MSKDINNISSVKKGMNRDSHPSTLQENEYVTAKNALYSDTSGNGIIMLQNEPSNLLCSKFKEGYKVIGHKVDINKDVTYFFLTNPDTKFSEIGYIKNNTNINTTFIDNGDELECGECDYKIDLGKPLEDINQPELCEYITIIEDSCNGCLNFSINHPINSIVIKSEKKGDVIYWTDGNNNSRHIKLYDIDYYKINGENSCGVVGQPTCVDCSKLDIFRKFGVPAVVDYSVEFGGNLKMGSYELLFAYCDMQGNEISNYFYLTPPIYIFDDNNNRINKTDTNSTTNLAINLHLKNIDNNYSHYKIAVVQVTGIDGAVSYYEEGVHTTNDTSVYLSNDTHLKRITLEKITNIKPTYLKANGLVSSNGYLFQYGLESRRDINLQPIANLLGAFTRWVTVVAEEDLYKDGANNSKYRGYMRNENYPFSIKFNIGDYSTPLFPLVNRPPTQEELLVVDNLDTKSINNYSKQCTDTIRDKKWQYYNTASTLGRLSDDTDCDTNPSDCVSVEESSFCFIRNIDTITPPQDDIVFNIEGIDFYDLKTFLNDYREAICDPDSIFYNSYFCDALNNEYPEQHCTTYFDDSHCDLPPNFLEAEVFVDNVYGDSYNYIYKDISEYNTIRRPSGCNFFKLNDEGKYDPDDQFVSNYFSWISEFELMYRKVFKRQDYLVNTTPQDADYLLDDTVSEYQSYFFYYYGSEDVNELLLNDYDSGYTNLSYYTFTPDNETTVISQFYSKLHKNALFFYGELLDNDTTLLDISQMKDLINPSIALTSVVRVSIYDGDRINNPPLITEVFNMYYNGKIIEIDKNILSGDNFIVAIDTPIMKTDGDYINGSGVRYHQYPKEGCFKIRRRHREKKSVVVNFDSIVLSKKELYETNCKYTIPKFNSCGVVPYEYGKFGYYESTETYPDNQELFNSNNLKISVGDIPEEYENEFKEYFVDNIDDGVYVLNNNTNLSCKNIRLFKFPDNNTSKFMLSNKVQPFARSLIYPIGVMVDPKIVNSFLDIAVKNGLITSEERSNIDSYEIYRGDRSISKSIIAKGLLYDMYKYNEDSDDVYYSNYPYNDLGDDFLNYSSTDRNDVIHHPFNGDKNNKFTFHSPDIHFNKPSLPNEMYIEGYQFGKSEGIFSNVKDHPKYVLLSKSAYRTAGTLATVELILEKASKIADLVIESSKNYWIEGGLVWGGNPIGSAASTAAIGIFAISEALNVFPEYGRKKFEWLKIMYDIGHTYNFANYYSSVGYYNYMKTNNEEGNMLRGLPVIKYLSQGRFTTTNNHNGDKYKINNTYREESVFIDLGKEYYIDYPSFYNTFDNGNINISNSSRFSAKYSQSCYSNKTSLRNIASPYVSLQHFLPNQYGSYESVKWLPTGKRINLSNITYGENSFDDILKNISFGGDIYITRFSLKRKFPFFVADSMELADRTPFEYLINSNIISPRYYINYNINKTETLKNALMPTIESEYELDCNYNTGNSLYIKGNSKFYLYYYGIPQFLVESEINNNYRYAGKEYWEDFYPNVGDYVEWTQEKNVSIKKGNLFLYNNTYSKQQIRFGVRLLPTSYNKSLFDRLNNLENGVIYSLQDSTEQDINDPWVIYRPLDYYQFKTSYGKLISLDDIESSQIMGRFENQVVIFNAIDVLRERVTPTTKELGDGGIFATRPLEFKSTELGYAGTQHITKASCEYGHFWVDAKRGQVFNVDLNGKNLTEITVGLQNWFKEHLPFKILNGGIHNLYDTDLDNAYKGLGLTMVWDSRFKRVFLTKKDYVVRPEYKGKLYYDNGVIYLYEDGNIGSEVSFLNTNIFEDVSFTVAYSPLTKTWISYYDFKPNYYIAYNNHFKSGINYSYDNNEEGLWSHLLTNKSYQVFYGKRYGWGVELPVKEMMTNGLLKSVEYWLDSKRYHNDYDYTEKRDVGFNKAWVYNNSQNTGQLNLVTEQKNNMHQKTLYPKYNTDSVDILATENDKNWSFNYLFNMVNNEYSNVPVWLYDQNYIESRINMRSLNYKRMWKDYMKGDWFILRLIQDKESRFKQILKWVNSKEKMYQ